VAHAPGVSDIVNYLRIDDALATSGQPTEEELAAAAGEGVEVVINLALHDDPRYSLADEAGTVRSLGMSYIHIPVQFDNPREDELYAFFDAFARHRKHKVLVHCAANKRVTAFLGLYRVIREGWDTDAAFAPMQRIWEPNPIWASFIRSALAQQREG
jgi:protein tyrosine phosphatase (PTP) superfamily phosphohydrolase (DUF442 family)